MISLTRARHEINESVESLEHDFGAGMSEIPFDSTRVSSSPDANEFKLQVIHVINDFRVIWLLKQLKALLMFHHEVGFVGSSKKREKFTSDLKNFHLGGFT